jgi:hypothetical protein
VVNEWDKVCELALPELVILLGSRLPEDFFAFMPCI